MGSQAVIGGSLGIAVLPADGSVPDVAAEECRHRAATAPRRMAGGRSASSRPKWMRSLQERRRLELDLHRALAQDEFELFYQPHGQPGTRTVCGFEALLRWNHPTRGLLSRRSSSRLAEEIGLIVPIGQWVLREACRAAAVGRTTCGSRSICRRCSSTATDLVRSVTEALQAPACPRRGWTWKSPRSVLLQHSEQVLAILHELRELGLHISMDDFGTGYSSLSYLRRFPFDKIKIDRSFIRDLPDSKGAAAIVRAIIRMSASLGMAITAEGVETAAQLSRLRGGGVHRGAGIPVRRSAAGRRSVAGVARDRPRPDAIHFDRPWQRP